MKTTFVEELYEDNNNNNKNQTKPMRIKKPHKLSLFHGCGHDKALTGHFSMPSLRLEVLDKEYQEPVRDRDKNWALDSQRNILLSPPNMKIDGDVKPPLKLGTFLTLCLCMSLSLHFISVCLSLYLYPFIYL